MRSSLRILLLGVLTVAVLAGCRDLITSPDRNPGTALRTEFECVIRPSVGAVICNSPEDKLRAGPLKNVILGGQGTYVNLHVGGTDWNAGTRQFSVNIAIENLTQHPFATTDGTTPNSSGTRLFLARPLTHGAVLTNPDGMASFTASGQQYLQYSGIIAAGDTATARTWTFGVPPGVEVFYATFYVWTTVENPGMNLLIPRADGTARLAAGGSSACVRRNDGVYCWGENTFSQIGDGTVLDRYTASLASGSAAFVRVSVGGSHACGVNADGDAFCWGDATGGRLGTSAGLVSGTLSTPTAVSGAIEFLSVHAGAVHTCGLAFDGSAWCWGDGSGGQLGSGADQVSGVPVAVAGGRTFKQMAVGGSTCGIDLQGAAWCWGPGSAGQLGDGSSTSSNVPVPVAGGHTFDGVAVGGQHACGVTRGGDTWCWGAGGAGQLGSGSNSPSPIPVQADVQGQSFVKIAAGTDRTCALTGTGSAFCWGAGPLGTGGAAGSNQPEAVAGGISFTTIAPGEAHTCGLSTADIVYCWGENAVGQLGDGTRLVALQPEWPAYFGPHVASLVATADPVVVSVGGTASAGVYGLALGGAEIHGIRKEWSSADDGVATVDGYGLVSGVALGATALKALRINSSLADSVRVTPAVEVATPYTVAIVSGDNQTAPPGSTLADPLVLRITHNSSGYPAQGITVTFSGDGFTSPATDATDSDGYAQTVWTLGAAGGAQAMSATSTAGSVQFAAFAGTEPSRVEISPSSHTFVALGDSAQFTAAVYDDQNVPIAAGVVWSSSDEAVFTATAAGWVHAVDNGVAYLVATSGSVADTIIVTVQQETASVTVAPSTHDFSAGGQTHQFLAVARDANNNPVASAVLDWYSTDSAVATASSSGLVTSVADGMALIVAASGSYADTATVTVTGSAPPEPVLSSISVTPQTFTFYSLSEAVQFHADTRDQFGSPIAAAVTWSSTNSGVATVSSSGVVTSLADGTTRIIAASGVYADTSDVTVAQESFSTGLFRVASGAVTGTSATISATEGDLVIVYAFRSGSTASPTAPGAQWTPIQSGATGGGGTNAASLTAYRFAPSAGMTSTGTWTDATAISWAIFRGAHPTTPIGNSARAGENTTGTYIRYPAVALAATNGSSWLVGFGGRVTTGAHAAVANAPGGMTNHHSAPATPYIAVHTTNGARSANWPQTEVTTGTTSVKYQGVVVEVLEGAAASTPGAPVISVDYLGEDKARLNIIRGSSATTHEVHRSTSSNFTPSAGTRIATLGASPYEYVDTSLLDGTTYYYKVVSINGTLSATSNEVSVTPMSDAVSVVMSEPSDPYLAPGDNLQMSAQAYDADGAPVWSGYQWSTSDNAVVTVNSSGLVTAVAPGSAYAIVTIRSGAADSVLVSVLPILNSQLEVTSYRGRNDDGGETSASWKAAANTPWQQSATEPFRLRIQVEHPGTGGFAGFGWQWTSPAADPVFTLTTGPAALPGQSRGAVGSPDGQYVAIAHHNGNRLTVLRTSDWSVVSGTPTLPNSAYGINWSPDGQYIVVGHGTSPFITVVRSSNWTAVSGLANLPNEGYEGDFSPDMSLLAMAHAGGNHLTVYRTSDWTVVPGTPNLSGTFSSGFVAKFSPDGQHLAWGGSNGLRVLRTSDWGLVSGVGAASGTVNDLAFNADGSRMYAATGTAPNLNIYNTSTWTRIANEPAVGGSARNVEFTPDGKFLVLGISVSPFARVVRLSDLQLLPDSPALPDRAEGIVFTHGGSKMLLAHYSGDFVSLFDVSRAWADVGTGAVRFANSPFLTDEQATSEQFFPGTPFMPGFVYESGHGRRVRFTSSGKTELEAALELFTGEVSPGDTVRLRVRTANGTPIPMAVNPLVVVSSGSQ
jgi:alpha-tubulin suppressor-like RCC1 family protein